MSSGILPSESERFGHAPRFSVRRHNRRFPSYLNLQIGRKGPDLLEPGNQVAGSYPVQENGDNMIHTCCRRRPNGLETAPMSLLTYPAGSTEIGSEDLSERNLQVIPSPLFAQIEDAFERHSVSVQRTRKQTCYSDRPEFARAPELGYRTRSSGAQIDDRKAVGRIEPAAVDARPLPAQRKVPVYGHVTKGLPLISMSRRGGRTLDAVAHVTP